MLARQCFSFRTKVSTTVLFGVVIVYGFLALHYSWRILEYSVEFRKAEASALAHTVDIIVPVHDALLELQILLASIERWTPKEQCSLFLIDDRSAQQTVAFLKSYVQRTALRARLVLLSDYEEEGYSFAVNRGIQLGSSPYVVILNSDTIVTEGWLQHMIAVAERNSMIGIVSPLSNAASYQSVPAVKETVYNSTLRKNVTTWSKNPLLPGWSVAGVARAVQHLSLPVYPALPFLNGFCFLVKRQVFREVGLLDTTRFPYGYGEENDLVLRVRERGYQAVVDDGAYIFHYKTRSFEPHERERYAPAGRRNLLEKHGRKKVEQQEEQMRSIAERSLSGLRTRLTFASRYPQLFHGSRLRVLFLLPSSNAGGGSTSVVQEALQMEAIGITVRIALWDSSFLQFSQAYPTASHLFFPWPKKLDSGKHREAMKELLQYGALFDVVVATMWNSVATLLQMWEHAATFLPAYYVQDYEPLFYARADPQYDLAFQTYSKVAAIGGLLYCKSSWLVDKLRELHVGAVRVSAGIEGLSCPLRGFDTNGPIRIAAMIRPKTPRRNPALTLQVLLLAKELFPTIQIITFGCTDAELRTLNVTRRADSLIHLGQLNRTGVALLFGTIDIFLDLSYWQAYGRSAAEAMTCGSTAIVTDVGGASEFIQDGYNGYLVNASSSESPLGAIRALVQNPLQLRLMQERAMQLRADLRIEVAVLQRLSLFMRHLLRRFDRTKFYPWSDLMLGIK